MARQRIIYQSESVAVDGVTAIGVQSCSYGLDVTPKMFSSLVILER